VLKGPELGYEENTNLDLTTVHKSLFEQEQRKLANLESKTNEFGLKHFGNEFHNKINQNTQESMRILTDPSIPRVANLSLEENQKIMVRTPLLTKVPEFPGFEEGLRGLQEHHQ
jgi:hypothetical protein